MQLVPQLLAVSGALGVSGVVASFTLYFLLREFGFAGDMIRTLLFLKLIVAGYSSLYLTRSAGWFWQKPYPAPLLLGATFGTEILGTLIAVYGFLITPVGWKYALWMWAYALVWFVINGCEPPDIRFSRGLPETPGLRLAPAGSTVAQAWNLAYARAYWH